MASMGGAGRSRDLRPTPEILPATPQLPSALEGVQAAWTLSRAGLQTGQHFAQNTSNTPVGICATADLPPQDAHGAEMLAV
jgi:hypothetical protein